MLGLIASARRASLCTFMAQRTAPSTLSNTMSSRVASGIDDPAAVLRDSWVNQIHRTMMGYFRLSAVAHAPPSGLAR
jgi:hypothetical protein